MRRDSNLELQCRRRGDLDFELCAHMSLHSDDDMGFQRLGRVGVCGEPSAPPGTDPPSSLVASRSAAPPSESHADLAAPISLRLVLRRTPLPTISVTVSDVREAPWGGSPMSAWLPITRESVMCVKAASLPVRLCVPYCCAPAAVVHRFARRFLMFKLPDQLTLCFTKSTGEVRVLGCRNQR